MKELQYPVRPGRYRHFKGNEYQVLGVARHSETEEEMVVYRALYGEGGLCLGCEECHYPICPFGK